MRTAYLTMIACAFALASCNNSASHQLSTNTNAGDDQEPSAKVESAVEPVQQASHAHHPHFQSTSPHESHSSTDNGQTAATGDVKSVMIGQRVPDFVVTIDGKSWRLSELQKNAELTKDGTLVFTFWCSFCHSCRTIDKRLDGLAREYRGQVAVVALDASAGESLEQVKTLAAELGLELPIALDQAGTTADIFGVNKTTTTVIIDSQGVLRYRGQFKQAEEALQAVLAGQEVATPETNQYG